MKNKFVKYLALTIGVACLGYGAFRITEYFTGVIRLKYAVITVKKYDVAQVDETPLE